MGAIGEVARAQVISANGATDTIFINYSAPNVRFKFNNNGFYTDITWPCTIVNNNPGGPPLKVLFENNVTLSDASSYFICGSANIQFGSTALKSDGTRPKITVDGVTDYPGLIQNGASLANGYANISIFNLEVLTRSDPPFATLAQEGGWIGQTYFGKASTNCYIINCSSSGAIGVSSGGIVGSGAGRDGGNLKIIGCNSFGTISGDAGGIAGYEAGKDGGEVFVQYSWSSRAITGNSGGGIFGTAAGWNGTASANDCFSVGAIAGADSGGIFGKFAGTGSIGPATALRCYSRGNITGGGAGGIFGGAAGRTVADNCYSLGTVTGPFAAGIYGNGSGGGAIQANCYEANGNWNSVAANLNLTGTPPGGSVIGTTWADTALNQPYDFSKFGYTPYSTNNISIAGGVPSLVQSFSQTVTAGSSSLAAIVSGLNYTILQKKRGNVVGAYPTITINSTTGVISTTARTAAGTYTLTVDSEVTGVPTGYSITEVVLTVKAKSGRPKKSW